MKRKGFCRVLGFWALVGGAVAWSALCTGQAADDAAVIPNRAKVPGKLRLRQRTCACSAVRSAFGSFASWA